MSRLHASRAVLHRPAPPGCTGPPVVWVGLNPSTADADHDDPTVRRIRGFSLRGGFGDVTLVNLYALRATSPTVLYRALREHPLKGRPTPTQSLIEVFSQAHVVLAWGRPANQRIARRAQRVQRLADRHAALVYRIGSPLTGGHPRHPLYAPYALGLSVGPLGA